MRIHSGRMLLLGAILTTPLLLPAQDKPQDNPALSPWHLDASITYDTQHSNTTGGNGFWLQGGSAQAHAQFRRGLGVAADLAGQRTANRQVSGAGLDTMTFTVGPRYTWSPAHRRSALFGQGLLGEAHGFNSVFPSSAGAKTSASSLAVKIGGGVNVRWSSHLDVRAFEADWLRTQLPNATTGVQNNLCLGAGIVYRFR